jgi:hypothetical protein
VGQSAYEPRGRPGTALTVAVPGRCLANPELADERPEDRVPLEVAGFETNVTSFEFTSGIAIARSTSSRSSRAHRSLAARGSRACRPSSRRIRLSTARSQKYGLQANTPLMKFEGAG